MDKLKMQSVNLTDANIDKIAALFPNCITETADENGRLKKAVNFDMLKAMLSEDIAEGDEAYEFTWVGKKAAIAEANRPIRKTLRPCVEESVNWDTTENLYIEGDNLEVLKLLQESYLGKVKMIYIDPPYNTGNDFIYRDDFKQTAEEYAEESGQLDEEGNRLFKNTDSNGRFHSDWCSMIYSRLMLARNLLSDDGFIAISIGEEELNTLISICNEVLGESNFRNIIQVRRYDKNINLQFVDNGLSSMNVGLEYILIYSKLQTSKMTAVYRETTDTRASTGYWKGFWNNADRPTMRYALFGFTPSEGQWKWQQSIANEAVQNYIEYIEKYSSFMSLEEYWKETGKNKRFLRHNSKGTGKNNGVEHWVAPSEGILRNSNWSDMLVSKQTGVEIPFDNPKNPDVICEIIKLFGVNQNDIILDFFSGSATTAHAVMQLNAEDGGHRKFIMVQLPEETDEKSEAYKAGYKNICEIGKERIRRAGAKINSQLEMRNAQLGEEQTLFDSTESKQYGNQSDKGENTQNNCELRIAHCELDIAHCELDTGFRVLKLDETNMQDVYYTPAETDQQMLLGFESNIKPDRTDLDLLFGCLLDWGLPLSMPYKSEQIDGVTVHTYNDGDLIACFDKDISENVVREIAKREPLRVVFRDDSFADSPAKINVEEIFKLLSPDTRVKVI